MREQVVAFPPQPVITQDNVTISIDTVFYFTVTDPFRATYEVANLLFAIEQLTVTTLRNVIGSLSLEEALTSRDKINADLRIVLDEATERWGLRVNRIELKSIDPPCSIQEAMEKQMRAERERRAVIINAEGVKQAQITTARARSRRRSSRPRARSRPTILTAEVTRRRRSSCAEGEAEATRQIFKAIHDGDPSPDLLTYQYIQALPRVADGQGMTLMLVPSDAIGAMGASPRSAAASRSGRTRPRDGPAEKALASDDRGHRPRGVARDRARALRGRAADARVRRALSSRSARSQPASSARSGANVGIQLLVFAVVSVVSLCATRKPLLRALIEAPAGRPRTLQTVVGRRAVVMVAIDAGAGAARPGPGRHRVLERTLGERAADRGGRDRRGRRGSTACALVVRPVGPEAELL